MQIIPGAEPWEHVGTLPYGVLCLHGFTGNPNTMRGVGEAFASAGFSVELPRLPGHGTKVEDMMDTTWADWSGEAEAAYQRLAARSSRVVVAGLSMGGSLTLWLAARHPEITALVCINPLVKPLDDEIIEMVQGMIDEGDVNIPGIGSDIADPDAHETAYSGTPLPPLLSLAAGVRELAAELGAIAMPLLLMTSTQDHVVEPVNSDIVASSVSGPVERVALERSYHVATLDYDKELVFSLATAFAEKVCAA